jgi:hypothetical protein
LVEANILEEHALSIFRAEKMSQDSEGPYIYIGLQEGESEGKGPLGANVAQMELDR